MLCGTLGTFAYWANMHTSSETDINPNVLAAYCAAVLVKTCNKSAFGKMHRSMLTTVSIVHNSYCISFDEKMFLFQDMIEDLPKTFQNLFE
jgi:hypothetical protein